MPAMSPSGDDVAAFLDSIADDRRREGDSALASFAPRKQATVLYLAGYFEGEDAALLERLGPVKTGKGCVYVKRLDDVDRDVLRELVERSLQVRRDADRASRAG